MMESIYSLVSSRLQMELGDNLYRSVYLGLLKGMRLGEAMPIYNPGLHERLVKLRTIEGALRDRVKRPLYGQLVGLTISVEEGWERERYDG